MNAHLIKRRIADWRTFNYASQLPEAVVLAEHDWLAYVLSMAESLPSGETLDFPSEEDVLWAWPDGVIVLFSEPLPIEHVIISKTSVTVHQTLATVEQPGAVEQQLGRALCISRRQLLPAKAPDGSPLPPILAYPMIWIGEDPSDTITGHWTPGTTMLVSDTGAISQSSRVMLSIITALGHRLTRLDAASTVAETRGERRRFARELPELRVLRLASGASVSSRGSSVAWSRRWMVRGHWRLQPYGPGRTLRRPLWIDPYVKGPEDKPLDVRQTVWRASATNPPDGGRADGVPRG